MSATIQVLVVAGGGGGAHATGAGGGAGGLIYNANHGVIAQGYAITVGGGGGGGLHSSGQVGTGSDGQNSVFNSLVAIGGGGGGANDASGRPGGSGGGAGHVDGRVGGAGTSGQGFAGGSGGNGPNFGAGGGGGASGIGSTGTNTSGGDGGAGLSYSISGTATHYAGGGGGGTFQGGTLGLGGLGGGGNAPGNNGTANTGGGGGGQRDNSVNDGGSGGSGIVIIAYATNGSSGVSTNSTGGTITTVGANTIHTFTSSGTFTLVPTTSLWTPAQLTTALWLDASDASTLYDATTGGNLVAADGTIARWEDKSGNTRNATQATSGDRPTRRINIQNGRDILRLATAETDFLSLPNFLTSFTAGSGFFIAKSVVYPPTDLDYTGPVLGDFGDSADANVIWNDGNVYEDFGSSSRYALTPPSSLANWVMSGFISALNDWRAYFNAEILNTQTSNTVSWLTVPKIGRSTATSASYYFPGDIAEIIVLSKAASTAERQLIEGYLAHKWGLSANLPAGHPYKSAAPTNSSSRRNNTMIGNF